MAASRPVFLGHMASDHVNAFVPETLAFFCERAGFETLEVSTFFPGPLQIFNNWPVLPGTIDGTVYVGRAIPGWNYGNKATWRVAANRRGFIRVGERASVSPEVSA